MTNGKRSDGDPTVRLDAAGQVFGRFASRVATMLQGKTQPNYRRNVIVGPRILVTNAAKLVMTGGKASTKYVYRFSGYPGGLKRTSFDELFRKRPAEAFRHAVRRMLPKSRLGRQMLKRLTFEEGK